MIRVEFGHVGDDRFLWRVTLADKPRLDDTVLHLYVDADAGETTGRKGPAGASSTGTEYMLSVVGGRGSNSSYHADGESFAGAPVSYVAAANTVLMTADVNLARDEKGIRYHLYVLCHTITRSDRAGMSDSSPKKLIAGIPATTRKKILRLVDYQSSIGRNCSPSLRT